MSEDRQKNEIKSIHTLQGGRRLPPQGLPVNPSTPNVLKIKNRLLARIRAFDDAQKRVSSDLAKGYHKPGSMRLIWQ
jgi:hypothetical protein